MGKDDNARTHFEIRSFGRRRSRPLSARQQRLMGELLPKVVIRPTAIAPADISSIFAAEVDECWLEIGFGGAEHLIAQARQHQNVGFIGSEPFEDGVVKALSEIEAHSLKNVRLYTDDIRHILSWLPANSISRTFILFPDPWPKKRHHKRRLVNKATLKALARTMPQGARLRIATDIGDYVRTIFTAINTSSGFQWLASGRSDWQNPPDDWIPTRYEQKAKQQGRCCYYLEFERATDCDRESTSKA